MQGFGLFAGLWAVLFASGLQAGSSKKIAQTGFQFLSVNSDGRASAMGGAVTSLGLGSASLFFNPSGLAGLGGAFDVTASTQTYFAGIRHTTFSAAFRPFQGRYGVVGLSYQGVDYGEVQGTIVAPPSVTPDGYLDTELLEPRASALGVGYARALTDRFSVGGQVKLVTQNLGFSRVPVAVAAGSDTSRSDNELSPLAFDFGTQFKTGIKSLVFGMSVRNFSQEVKYAREGFQLPLLFVMGVSMDLMDLLPASPVRQSLILSVDATHDRSHTSKASEHVLVGLDYTLMGALSLRGGYASGEDLSAFSFGVGLNAYGVAVDYSYTPLDLFDPVHRTTVRLSL
jgi:hypothetical protein